MVQVSWFKEPERLHASPLFLRYHLPPTGMSSSSGFFDGFNPGAANTNSTTHNQRSDSAVRSRTRRLISFNDDEEDNSGEMQQPPSSTSSSTFAGPERLTARSRGATPSPYQSRGASPLPMSHPSRATESLNRGRQNGGRTSSGGFNNGGRDPFNVTESSRAAVDFLDSSWSSLQTLASSVLGSDIARPASNVSSRTHSRKPSRADPYMRGTPNTSTPSAWGPSAPSTPEIGAGTKEDRQAYVQAKKREALLLADTGPSTGRNTRHKRRVSGETSQLAIDTEQDEEALVYIHHVQQTDTITSLTIKYGCQPAIFRKANGFWPSDSIQSRKTVLLPVDSCSVKGRPIRPTPDTDLLNNDSSEDLNGSSIAPTPVSEKKGPILADTPSTEVEGDRVWKPESWVQIDNFPAPVEIGRVPRRALGFFPRTRRKSISYSDVDSPSTSFQGTATTTASSSVTSFHDSQSSQSTVLPPSRPHAGSSESTKPSHPKPGARHQRQRSNIQPVGPGVGSLDRSTMAPGPAMDGLSKFLSQHIPTLAPPPPPTTNPDSGVLESTSTAQSNATTSLDNIGGAFEGWFRKMTTRAKASFNELQQGTSTPQANGRAPPSGSDLIELDDALESRNTSSLLGDNTRRKPDLDRSGSSITTSAGGDRAGTSRTRVTGYGGSGFGDRAKDD